MALRVFETIDEGDPSVGVPPFNGGLFNRERAPLLYRARLPDAVFAPLVDALSRRGKTVLTEEIPAYSAVALAGLGWSRAWLTATPSCLAERPTRNYASKPL